MKLPFFAKKRTAFQGGGQHPGSLVNITGICRRTAKQAGMRSGTAEHCLSEVVPRNFGIPLLTAFHIINVRVCKLKTREPAKFP
jgi:hypothetical protein